MKPVQNILFACKTHPEIKPRGEWEDCLSTEIGVTKGLQDCLYYSAEIPQEGLTYQDLVLRYNNEFDDLIMFEDDRLKRRLEESIQDDTRENAMSAERRFFEKYYEKFLMEAKYYPALLPQAYVDYNFDGSTERPQRMDFLILPSDTERWIIEIDGSQHYATEMKIKGKEMRLYEGDTYLGKREGYEFWEARPKMIGKTLKQTRRLQARGYTVLRYSCAEVWKEDVMEELEQMFKQRGIPKCTIM